MKIIYLVIGILYFVGHGLCRKQSGNEDSDPLELIQDKLERLLKKTKGVRDHLDILEKKIDELEKRSNAQLAQMAELQYANWTTIQRRQDGTEDFYRNWTEYRMGFGTSERGEFFMGLEKLHQLTSEKPHELLIILKDWENDTRYAHYNNFRISGEEGKYAIIELGDYSGTAGDGMDYYMGQKFSTFDSDNDEDDETNCAELYKSAWWFKTCALR
ncbi:angiopoietin-related protein 6-like [Musca vetustissima]|uniref:angiopoietin-related protein 6-like n=1 Tax=Musca vetustissima TaxID=27455 RepID=UPI002AB6438F|nr:angiopoietin-related protein 6-like [Musca vetustissima]